jgi:hypothetical protein
LDKSCSDPLIEETRPRGDAWHVDLISRVGQAVGHRPAILTPGLVASADETRRFRNRATRTCDNFDPDRITPTVAAADDLVWNLPAAVARFRDAIDP